MSVRARAVLLVLPLFLVHLGGAAGALIRPAAGSPSQDRATFGVGPASFGRVDPRGYFSYQTGPGGSYRDQAAVVNFGSAPLHLSLYVADLTNAPDGSVVAGLRSDSLRDAGRWMSIPARYHAVNVPGRTSHGPGKVIVPLLLTVPASASPGDHGAALIASLSTVGKDPKGQNVRLDQRVASRIYVRVRGPIHARLEIVGLSARYRQPSLPWARGHVTVTYTVRNTGNVRLSADQLVTAQTWLSSGQKARPQRIALLFPGGQQRVSVDVAHVVPTIVGHAHVTLTPHLFTDQPPQPLVQAKAQVRFFAVPWVLLFVLMLVALLVLGWRAQRRRRQPARHAASPRAVVGSAP